MSGVSLQGLLFRSCVLSFIFSAVLPFYKAVKIHDVPILCKFAVQVYFAN